MTRPNSVRVALSEMRIQMSELMLRVWRDGEHIVITRFGKPIGVVVPFEWYQEKTK